MNIFIDEFGQIFCEFKKGIYSMITKEYFEKIKNAGLIEDIEICIGDSSV